MKKYITKSILFLVLIAIAFNGAVNAFAIENGGLKSNIIPPEGRLFRPDNAAPRATVVMALYIISDDKTIQGTVTGSTGATQAAPQSFLDVSKNSPYYVPINFCAAKRYISGYSDGTFRPESSITRAEMCGILNRFLSLRTIGKTTLPSDVPSGHWASAAISAVISNGFMSGYVNNTFKPDNALTRAELATIIANVKNLQMPENIREFSDVPKTYWAYKSILCVSAPSDTSPSPDSKASSLSVETEVIRLINEARTKAGVSALKLDTVLCEIASIKAQDMVDNNYFNHKSPKWGSSGDMLKAFGVSYSCRGENIAYGAYNAAQVFSDWIDSPPHYDNLLDSEFTKAGVGYATSKDGTVFWVMELIG